MSVVLLLVALAVIGVLAAIVTGRLDAALPPPTSSSPHRPLPPGPLEPRDVDDLQFSLAVRGYRMDEVDAVLARLRAELAVRSTSDAMQAPVTGQSSQTAQGPVTGQTGQTGHAPETSAVLGGLIPGTMPTPASALTPEAARPLPLATPSPAFLPEDVPTQARTPGHEAGPSWHLWPDDRPRESPERGADAARSDSVSGPHDVVGLNTDQLADVRRRHGRRARTPPEGE